MHDSDPCRDRRTELRRRAHHDRLPALERKRRNLELDGLVLGRRQQCSEVDGLRVRPRRRDRPGYGPGARHVPVRVRDDLGRVQRLSGRGPASTELGTAQLVCLSAAGCPAGATNYGSPFGGAWTSNLSSIPGAGWIWRPGVTGATPNADFDEAVFATTFVLAGRPTSGWIDIAVDDSAEIRVNGEVVGSIGARCVREPDEVRPLGVPQAGPQHDRDQGDERPLVRHVSRSPRTRPGSCSGARSRWASRYACGMARPGHPARRLAPSARTAHPIGSGEMDSPFDVLVVGAGCAGMRAAIEAHDAGARVAVVSKLHPTRSHSGAAEGGINAALGNKAEDSPETHAFDTVKGSDYLGDQDAIEIFTREAPGDIYQLEHWGCVFSRNDEGKLDQRPFGAAGSPRTVYSADITGHVLIQVLFEQLRSGWRRGSSSSRSTSPSASWRRTAAARASSAGIS